MWTQEEAELVKGSNDFYGMNHYTANYVKHVDTPAPLDDVNGNVDMTFINKAGDCIGPETQSVWLRPHPEGFRKLLIWLHKRYNGPIFYVTENGTSVKDEHLKTTAEEIYEDTLRCDYFRDYITAAARARCESGVDVRGYFAWSFMECVSLAIDQTEHDTDREIATSSGPRATSPALVSPTSTTRTTRSAPPSDPQRLLVILSPSSLSKSRRLCWDWAKGMGFAGWILDAHTRTNVNINCDLKIEFCFSLRTRPVPHMCRP